MLWSDTSPDVNTSEIRCLKLNTNALLRKAIKTIIEEGLLGLSSLFPLTICYQYAVDGKYCTFYQCGAKPLTGDLPITVPSPVAFEFRKLFLCVQII